MAAIGESGATIPAMRVRVLLVLVAMWTMAAVPPEAVLVRPAGSAGQVASCVEPNGVLRETSERDHVEACADDAIGGPTGPLLGVVAVLVLAVALLVRSRHVRRTRPLLSAARWRLADAVAGSVAPWRGPPLPV